MTNVANSYKTGKQYKREKLIKLSQEARAYKKQRAQSALERGNAIEADQWENTPVNKILVMWYEAEGHKELKTLWQWRKAGFKVRKGSSAFLVWGKRKKATKEVEGEETSFKFFPLAYLFSRAQVEPIEQ